MSLCKAILHTPRMMYGGREDMCPHLHTITPYYLIPFRFPVLSQEGGYIVCSYQQWYIYQNDPNKYYPTIYILLFFFCDLFQIKRQIFLKLISSAHSSQAPQLSVACGCKNVESVMVVNTESASYVHFFPLLIRKYHRDLWHFAILTAFARCANFHSTQRREGQEWNKM